MKIETSLQLSTSEKIDVFKIWNTAYPAQIAYKWIDDFEKYLSACHNSIHLLAKDQSHVIAWLCTFDRNGERWFALIVDPAYQRTGIGKSLLLHMQGIENYVNGWIVTHNEYIRTDGKPYLSPKSFYQNLGFEITDEKLETDILSTVKIKWNKNK